MHRSPLICEVPLFHLLCYGHEGKRLLSLLTDNRFHKLPFVVLWGEYEDSHSTCARILCVTPTMQTIELL